MQYNAIAGANREPTRAELIQQQLRTIANNRPRHERAVQLES